jgi:hypothetical protein
MFVAIKFYKRTKKINKKIYPVALDFLPKALLI